uniref:Uncharacterized protein n=1 Tax=Parascaris equorum TaxID=6256 RepID=A0A914RX76_PAREQ
MGNLHCGDAKNRTDSRLLDQDHTCVECHMSRTASHERINPLTMNCRKHNKYHSTVDATIRVYFARRDTSSLNSAPSEQLRSTYWPSTSKTPALGSDRMDRSTNDSSACNLQTLPEIVHF